MAKGGYVVVFGGSSVDYTFKQRSDLTYSEEPDVKLLGGKGANQAIAVSRAGYPVKMITIVGSDANGKIIIDNLKHNGVDTTCCKILKDVKSDSCKVYVSVDGENDIKRSTEAINNFTPQMIDEFAEVIKNAKFVISQAKLPRDVYARLIEFCYDENVPIVFTPCPPKALRFGENDNEELLKKVTYITANEKESLEISGETNVLASVLSFPNLIATAGEKGVFFNDNGSILNIPACHVSTVADTTGAGDTFCGNFVVGLLNGLTKLDAVKRAVCASTLKLAKTGAQTGMPYKDELDKFCKKQMEMKND